MTSTIAQSDPAHMPLDLTPNITVWEWGESLAIKFAGRLLADLGADVRCPGGRRGASGNIFSPALAAYLARGKTTLKRADLQSVDALRREQPSIVLYDGSSRALNDFLILGRAANAWSGTVVIATPYGLQGPYRGLCEDELLLFALSGIASITPEDPDDRSAERPMSLWGHQGALVGGLVAAISALQAHFTARTVEQGVLVDVAALDALASMPVLAHAHAFSGHALKTGPRERPTTVPRGLLQCSDGFVFTQGGDDNWSAWAEAVGRPDWLLPPMLEPQHRQGKWPELWPVIERWLLAHPKSVVSSALQQQGATAFPVHTIPELLCNDQMVARAVFSSFAGPAGDSFKAPVNPIRLADDSLSADALDSSRAIRPPTGAAPVRMPRTRTERDHARPLDGVRVADFSWVVAGPQATKWLAALGADVIKVESHLRPDRMRGYEPFRDGEPSLDGSIAWSTLNYSKRDMTLNLNTAEGRVLAKQLVMASDVMIENFSVGVADRLGIGYGSLSRGHEKLVMLSASGLGQSGPDCAMKAYGKSIHAFTGSTFLNSWPGTIPKGTGTTWADPLTGMYSVLAILAGVEHASRTGRGLHFDLSMAECTISILLEAFMSQLNEGIAPLPVGNGVESPSPHDAYQCQDGGWVAITPHGPEELQRLRLVLSSMVAAGPPVTRAGDLSPIVRRWAAGRGRESALGELRAVGVCAAPVLDFDELPSNPHYVGRQLIAELSSPLTGPFGAFKLPWVQDPPGHAIYAAAPPLGRDTDEVLRSVLGLSQAEIEDFSAAGALI